MGAFSIWHLLIIAAAAMLLFGGRGKISDLMGDFGKGIKSFKAGLNDQDQPDEPLVRRSDADASLAPASNAAASQILSPVATRVQS